LPAHLALGRVMRKRVPSPESAGRSDCDVYFYQKYALFADVQRDEERVHPQHDQHLRRRAGHEAGAGGYW
jgi:hypothetical protein